MPIPPALPVPLSCISLFRLDLCKANFLVTGSKVIVLAPLSRLHFAGSPFPGIGLECRSFLPPSPVAHETL